MNAQNQQIVNNSFPVLSLLGAVLVVLKLMGKISISWFWVTAPFWIPLTVLLFLFIAFTVFAVLTGMFK